MRSRKFENILEEAKRLVANGNRELVLTGINISTYGKDRKEPQDLVDLVEALQNVVGLERIRLGSLEPTFLTEEAVDRLSRVRKLCDHFHVSLQSGAEKTLKDMKRRYTKEEYARTIERIRRVFPDAGITTDVMVGFPGETEEDFQESKAFLEAMAFSQIHVFSYSPRKGTPAAVMTPVVSEKEKKRRSDAFIALGEMLKEKFEQRFLGTTQEVLVEGNVPSEERMVQGHTTNYMLVHIPSEEDLTSLQIPVKLRRDPQGCLTGDRIENQEG